MPPSLSLFGVIHFDDLRTTTEDLESFADGTDAIFIEQPQRVGTAREFATALLRAPLGVLGVLFWGVAVHAPLMIAFNRDVRPTEQVALERVVSRLDVPAHGVDENLFAYLSRRGLRATVLNWAILGVFVWARPLHAAVTVCLLFVGLVPTLLRARGHRIAAILAVPCWFLAAFALLVASVVTPFGLLLSLLLVVAVVGLAEMVRSVSSRNELMLDRIQEHVADHGYEDVVHVTGKGHLGGLLRRARERGLQVPRVHVSHWRDIGERFDQPEPEDLPGVGDGRPDGRLLAPDSERRVLRRRIEAGALDGLLMALLAILATAVLLLMAVELFGPDVRATTATVVFAAGLLGVPLALLVRQEWAQCTTSNKAERDLVVADADDGTPPTLGAVCLRNLLKPIDVIGVGLVAIYATERNQRLGDLVAGTVVGEAADGAPEAATAEPDPAAEENAGDSDTESTPSAATMDGGTRSNEDPAADAG